MHIRLDLSVHCIETELKRVHKRAVSGYFKAGGKERQGLEEVIEAARHALERLDFQTLRASYPALAGGSNAKIIFSANADHSVIMLGLQKILLSDFYCSGDG